MSEFRDHLQGAPLKVSPVDPYAKPSTAAGTKIEHRDLTNKSVLGE